MEKFIIIIRPPSRISISLKELWQYRELFYFFTWRDIKVKYKQTVLGIFWAILQPLAMMILFTFIFSQTLGIQSGSIPYPVFVLSGLLIWNLFYGSVSHAAESMIQNSNIIKKIYFPRLIIPGSSVLVSLFDFVMAFLVFIVLLFFYRQSFDWTAIIYIPVAIVITIVSAFGIGSFFAALNVKFRDFRYALPFLLQVLFFASQVIYPLNIVHQQWTKYVLAINPVNAAVESFRAAFLNAPDQPDLMVIAIGLASALLFTFIGLFYFRKTESYFADIA